MNSKQLARQMGRTALMAAVRRCAEAAVDFEKLDEDYRLTYLIRDKLNKELDELSVRYKGKWFKSIRMQKNLPTIAQRVGVEAVDELLDS